MENGDRTATLTNGTDAPAVSASPAAGAAMNARSGREAILRVPMTVRIVLGSIRMPVSELMSLKRGSVVPLDRGVGEPVDIVVNNQLIARGEVIVVDEEGPTFAVSVVDVIQEPGDA